MVPEEDEAVATSGLASDSHLIRTVECVGRWPDALRGGTICLTPKGGVQASAQAPLEARPIVLLAQLYRLWAAARAPDLVKWVAHHKLCPLGEEGPQTATARYWRWTSPKPTTGCL